MDLVRLDGLVEMDLDMKDYRDWPKDVEEDHLVRHPLCNLFRGNRTLRKVTVHGK